jgi:hypothetical protein
MTWWAGGREGWGSNLLIKKWGLGPLQTVNNWKISKTRQLRKNENTEHCKKTLKHEKMETWENVKKWKH